MWNKYSPSITCGIARPLTLKWKSTWTQICKLPQAPKHASKNALTWNLILKAPLVITPDNWNWLANQKCILYHIMPFIWQALTALAWLSVRTIKIYEWKHSRLQCKPAKNHIYNQTVTLLPHSCFYKENSSFINSLMRPIYCVLYNINWVSMSYIRNAFRTPNDIHVHPIEQTIFGKK